MPHVGGVHGVPPLGRVEGDGGLVVVLAAAIGVEVEVAAAPVAVVAHHVVAVAVLVRVRKVEAPPGLEAKFQVVEIRSQQSRGRPFNGNPVKRRVTGRSNGNGNGR